MSIERFEQGLAEIPRTELPADFRDEILAKACVAPPPPTLLTNFWNSTPKTIAAAVAAAWVAIAVLKATMPSAADSSSTPALAAEPAAVPSQFLAWVERHRSLSANL